jgi:hypothetical protein
MKTTLTLLTALRLAVLAALAFAMSASAAEPSRLEVKPLNGAPGWLLDGKPHVPIQAQAGRCGYCEVKDGRLSLGHGATVQAAAPNGLGDSFSVACTLTLEKPRIGDAGTYFTAVGVDASGAQKDYPIKLGWFGQVCGVMNWLGPDGNYVVNKPVGKGLGQPVRLELHKTGPKLCLEADGKLLGEWTDPNPMIRLKSVRVSGYECTGTADDLDIRIGAGEVVFRETFDDAVAAYGRFSGSDLLPPKTMPLPASSFYSAGIPVYITWEWGPEMSTVWKEDGSFDWWEVDAYLRKLAALDPNGRLHMRFNFGPPPDWWAAMHPDDLVQTLTAAPDSKPEPGAGGWRVASFASKPYWEACERAARDLGRYVKQHPEGWRVLAVTYSGGGCEFFPHWGEGRYSDYSPAFLAGFRDWLTTRYETDAKLRAAWKNDDVSLVTAALPTPAERRRGDWFDFYDPAKGEQRIDFCRYYAEVTTGLITRLAKALKEGSDGRFYTRPMAGYQPCGPHFRFHAGPHADFATVLECPWIDGFFMPNDYYGRGHGGYTAFEIPVASVLLHGKTYITEIDDRTHLTTQFGQFGGLESATTTPWQTAQVAKRTVAAVLCNASGGEFKDWANGWWEDLETMNLIRQLNQLAQESANHDRTQIAQIAVVINPRSTMYLRDDSKLYSTLNLQQMLLVYPRIGAPHDRIMIDDLAKARDYDLYIVQDCLYLTEAQRRMLRDRTCRAGKTVLWLFAPGIVGDGGLRGVDGVSDLVGMRLAVHDATTRYCLKFSNGTHPYTRGVVGTEHFTFEDFGPLFHVDDPDVTVLGMGRYHMGLTRPAFAVKKQADWTSVYCGLPVLPPAVLRNIAREAGVHIYTDNDDFMAANNWLLTVCAASDGPRTIRLPKNATVVDALTGETTAKDASQFEVDMKYGETRVWKLEREGER